MISISGIKLTRIEVTRTDEADKVEGSYSLMSTEDKVLAKQSFNGYNDVKIELSSDSKKALNVLLKGIKNDIQDTLKSDDVYSAKSTIKSIVKAIRDEQAAIAVHAGQLAEYRKALKEFSYQPISEKDILG